jgi:hypothetical protein
MLKDFIDKRLFAGFGKVCVRDSKYPARGGRRLAGGGWPEKQLQKG